MNLKEIKEIITLMNENNLNEIEIEREGLKLKLKKSGVAIVRPLLGGLRGWRAKNFQTEPWKS